MRNRRCDVERANRIGYYAMMVEDHEKAISAFKSVNKVVSEKIEGEHKEQKEIKQLAKTM